MICDRENEWIGAGMKSAGTDIYFQNGIWSRYSSDKVDIGMQVANVFKDLLKNRPSPKDIRALSIGCGQEPQFRLLQALCDGGLYLLDVDENALDAIMKRMLRQSIKDVSLVNEDLKIFLDAGKTEDFVNTRLGGKPIDAVFLHHSLYYCEAGEWKKLMRNLFDIVLGPKGVIHCVLMASRSDDRLTTTWLYNHFAGRFCNHCNDQDMIELSRELKADNLFAGSLISAKTSHVRFFVDNFEQFMAVVWMILLYPYVHRYSESQKEEIIRHIYNEFFFPEKAMIQNQDHIVIYKNFSP